MAENQFLTYKGRPLVRKGNTLYYGNMYDPYVVMLTIKSTKPFADTELADKVTIQLLNTDPTVSPAEMVKKKGEKAGLYPALDMGAIWLERALAE
ncbi:MAG TPA: hypothetical protein PLS28_02430 [Clostridiales bacterium]|nr:hypothetical protein [Clostridiales bacterium]